MVRLKIQLTEQARQVLARYRALPRKMGEALARALDEQNQITLAQIVEKRLSFPREQPPVPEGLRVITNTLRKSMIATPAVVRGNEVRATIGSAVKYAALHEFGGVVQRWEQMRRAPQRVLTGGRRVSVRAAVRAGILTAAGKVRKGDRETRILSGGLVRVRAHSARYPARAFVRRTLEERAPEMGRALSAAVVAAARGGGGDAT